MQPIEVCNSRSRSNILIWAEFQPPHNINRLFLRIGVPRLKRPGGHTLDRDARAAPRREAARKTSSPFRRGLRILQALGRAMEIPDGRPRGLCPIAGGRPAFSRDRRRGIPTFGAARPARRKSLRWSGGRLRLALLRAAARMAPDRLPQCPRTCGRHGVCLWRSRAASHSRFGRDERVMGNERRASELPPVERALPAPARAVLPRGISLAVGAGGRAHRIPRNHARQGSPRGRAVAAWRGALDGPADPLLVKRQRRIPPFSLRRGDPCRPPRRRRARSGARAHFLLDLLSLTLERRPAVPRLPVGPAATRDGLSRDLAGAGPPPARRGGARALASGAGAPALAPLSPDVLLGIRQARQRRPQLAKPDGADLSLLDATPAAVDGLVRESLPDLVSQVLLFRDVRRGARRPHPHRRPAAVEIDRLRRHGGSPDDYCRDRQLRLLQSADR